jgi:hypothetical protein
MFKKRSRDAKLRKHFQTGKINGRWGESCRMPGAIHNYASSRLMNKGYNRSTSPGRLQDYRGAFEKDTEKSVLLKLPNRFNFNRIGLALPPACS